MEDRRHERRKFDMDKEIVKEALKEWLDDQFAKFGRWTLTGLLAMALVGAVYLAIHGGPGK